MKNLWKKLIIALALVLVMSAVPAQAHAADALAGAFLQVGLQAAGINFLQSWGSLTGLDAAKTAIARDLTDLFNSWAVAASKPYTTVQDFFEYYYPSQSWITVLSNFFKNPVTELYKAAIYINSNDIISALSDFAAWVKTEKFGANADSDGGTVENPVNVSDNKGSYITGRSYFMSASTRMAFLDEYYHVNANYNNSGAWHQTTFTGNVRELVSNSDFVLPKRLIYYYFMQNPDESYFIYNFPAFYNGSYISYRFNKQSQTSTGVTGYETYYMVVPGKPDTSFWVITNSTTGVTVYNNGPSDALDFIFICNGLLQNSQEYRDFIGLGRFYSTGDINRLLLGCRPFSVFYAPTYQYQLGNFSDSESYFKPLGVTSANIKSYSIQYQNTNNNQLPATIPSGETTVITPSGLTVIQSMTQAMAEQQVTINNLTYEIGALREQLDQQTTVIGQNTVLIGDLFDALDAVKVPVSDLSTAAAAIQAAESAANDTGQITINGVPYTLEEILTALASSTVTITDDEEEQHLVPADTVVGQILDTDLTPEAIANGIISVPVVEDTDGATVAPSVNVVTQTITVPAPTTAPTVGPTAIPTEGILPTVMPTGGVTAVPTTIPGETEVEAIQALPEAIASAIANIFVPDAELITGIYNTINGKFAFIQQMANFLNQILSVQEEIPAIYIYPHNKGATSTLEYAPADVERILVLDMTWYVPYRETVNNIISGFLWLAFLWAFWKRIPGIISGASVITDKYAYSHREWGE